jgi:geranylgeranyl diphosphate synthase type II
MADGAPLRRLMLDDRQRDLAGGAEFKIERYLAERAATVERELRRFLPIHEGPDSRLFDAMRYSLLASGKRLRPIFALAACDAVGGRLEAVLGFGCAVEMIHTYSLIHDDLPCMDDDDLRRGRPTNHKVYGEAIATLAGDGLLTDSFKVLARSVTPAMVSAPALIETIAELAEAAGSVGMVGGQVIDLLSEGRDLTLRELEGLHSKKTGALFVASVCGGARLGSGTERQIAALREYARKLGLAFQVADDLLDVESTPDQMGKRTQKDASRGKATYPSLLGIEPSRKLARELAGQALQAIDNFDERARPLRALAHYTVERQL